MKNLLDDKNIYILFIIRIMIFFTILRIDLKISKNGKGKINIGTDIEFRLYTIND